MSVKINIFENTVISCVGPDPYTFTSNDTGHLNHVELRSSDNSEINADLAGISFTDVAFRDNSTIGETTFQWLRSSSQTIRDVNHSPLGPRTLECSSALKSEYYHECQILVGKGYNISGVTAPLIIGDVPDIMYDYTTKTLSATVDTGQSYDLSWSISVAQEATYNPYNIPISSIIEIVKTDTTHAELRFKNTERWPWLFGIITVTLTDSVTGISTEAEIDCAVRWGPEIRGARTIDDLSHDYVYEIWMQNLYTETYVQLTTRLMNWSIREDLTDPYLIGKMTMYTSARLWGTLRPDQSSLTTDGEYQIVINAKCPSSSYMFYPYDQDFDIMVEVDTSSHVLQSLEIRDLASTIYTGTNSYQFKIYFSPSDADINSLVGNVVGVTPSDYSDMQYYIGTTKHTDSYGSYVDASISYVDLTKEGQLQVYVFDPNTGNRDDVYIVSEAPMPSPLTSLSIENVPIIETDPGTQRYSFRIYIDPQNGDLSNLDWDNWYTVMFTNSTCSFDSNNVHYDGVRYYIDAWIQFTNLSSTGQIGLVIKDSFNPSVYSEYVVTVIQ